MKHANLLAAIGAVLGCGSEQAAAIPAVVPSVYSISSAAVLADAKSAFMYAKKNITTEYACGWTRGTYM